MFRRNKLKIKSLVTLVARAENAKDRRLAIRKSWSLQEMEERRQLAIDSQFRLASLILSLGRQKENRLTQELELAAC